MRPSRGESQAVEAPDECDQAILFAVLTDDANRAARGTSRTGQEVNGKQRDGNAHDEEDARDLLERVGPRVVT